MPVRFGEVTLDEARRQLYHGDVPVHVSPKAFQLLATLVAASPRAMSKEELQQRLWPDTYVTEGNLASLVAELRSALGDDARKPRYIRTVHGFGYSLEAPLVETPAQTPAVEAPRALPAGAMAIAVLVLLVGSAGAFWMRGLRAPARVAPSRIQTLAVLPFDTRGAAATDSHLGLGMTDLIITRLSNVRTLTVRPTSAVRTFDRRDFDSLEVGQRLNVDAVLEGSIRVSGDRVRVTAQLFDVHARKPIWAHTFDEVRAEMLTIEDRISARVADAILIQLTPGERTLLAKRYTSDPEAYQLYIRGRYELRDGAGGAYGAVATAAGLFQKAVDKDPHYALAWAGLAQAHAMLAAGGKGAPSENYPKAERFAGRALELDRNLYEASVPLAAVRMYWYLDYPEAERQLQQALTLRPGDSEALILYGYLLQCLGRIDEAHAVRSRAIDVDPLNPKGHWGMANGFLTARRFDLAKKKIESLLAMMPNHFEAKIGYIRVLLAEQKFDEAIVAAQKLVEADQRARSLAFLAYSLARAGRKAEAREILQKLQALSRATYVDTISLILVHTALGEHEPAFALLEKALQEREYVLRLKTEPLLDPLRSDPRFDSLLRRAGFTS